MKKKFVLPKLCIPSDTSKNWFVYYSVYNQYTGNMKRLRVYIKRESKPLMRKVANEVITEITELLINNKHQLQQANSENPLLVTALNSMLELKHLKRRSIETYKTFINHFIFWVNSNLNKSLRVGDFNRNMATHYINELKKSNKSKRTVNNYLGALKTIFNFFIEQNFIEHNPFKQIKPIKVRKDLPVYIFQDNKEKILNHLMLNNIGLYYFAAFIYYTLMRNIELLSVKISDIKLNEKIITVTKVDAKTNRTKRVVIIDYLIPILVDKIKIHEYPSNYYLFGYGLKPHENRYTRVDPVSNIFKKCIKPLHLECKLYHFKHTGIQDYASAGVPLDQIAKQADITMETLQIYLELNHGFGSKKTLSDKAPALPGIKKLKSTIDLQSIINQIQIMPQWQKDYIYNAVFSNN